MPDPRHPAPRPARINRTFLGIEDHGILTATVSFDYGGSCQGLPAYSFGPAEGTDRADNDDDRQRIRDAQAQGMDFVRRLLSACSVTEWDQLMRAQVMVTASFSDVLAIEPMPYNNGRPFLIKEWAEEWRTRG